MTVHVTARSPPRRSLSDWVSPARPARLAGASRMARQRSIHGARTPMCRGSGALLVAAAPAAAALQIQTRSLVEGFGVAVFSPGQGRVSALPAPCSPLGLRSNARLEASQAGIAYCTCYGIWRTPYVTGKPAFFPGSKRSRRCEGACERANPEREGDVSSRPA